MKNILKAILLVIIFFSISSLAYAVSINEEPEYMNNKNIIIYGDISDENVDSLKEFGIIICHDENNLSPELENSEKFPSETQNAEGLFGIEISEKAAASDSAYVIRGYALHNDGSVGYSDNSILVNMDEYYGRIPLLSNVSLSEGKLFPELNEETDKYYILVEKETESFPELKFEKTVESDNAEYIPAGDISGEAIISLNTGFSSKEYCFRVRHLKKIELKGDKYLIKKSGVKAQGGNPLSETEAISIASDEALYFSLDTSLLPEHFVPVSAEFKFSGTASRICKTTEPELMTALFPNDYYPQVEELYENGKINPSLLKTKNDFTFAYMPGTEEVVDADFSLELYYFEDIPLPVYNNDANSAKLSFLSAEGANEIYPVFNKNIREYYAVYDKLPEALPQITAKPENTDAVVKTIYNDDSCTVTVISADGDKTSEYTIKFREYKTASMELKALAGKRSPYELFNMKFPKTDSTPYFTYPGVMENIAGTSHSHISTMAFDTSSVTDTDIKISSAELQLFLSTNCKAGTDIEIKRVLKTDWPDSAENKMYFAVANRHVNTGIEGVLNDTTHVIYTGGIGSSKYYRYYNIPLNTVGFSDAESVNLMYTAKWQSVDPPSGSQYTLVWLGKNGSVKENGIGSLPKVNIKYFVK